MRRCLFAVTARTAAPPPRCGAYHSRAAWRHNMRSVSRLLHHIAWRRSVSGDISGGGRFQRERHLAGAAARVSRIAVASTDVGQFFYRRCILSSWRCCRHNMVHGGALKSISYP